MRILFALKRRIWADRLAELSQQATEYQGDEEWRQCQEDFDGVKEMSDEVDELSRALKARTSDPASHTHRHPDPSQDTRRQMFPQERPRKTSGSGRSPRAHNSHHDELLSDCWRQHRVERYLCPFRAARAAASTNTVDRNKLRNNIQA